MDMRIAEPVWRSDERDAEASLVERLEAQVETLTQRLGRLERRQQRFADMIRLLLQLHDQTAARVSAVDGGSTAEDDEEALSAAIGQITRVTQTAANSSAGRPRRSVSRRNDV
jgi:uncharacterized membrane protein